MSDLFRARTTLVWFGLAVATGISWWLGTDHGFSGDAGIKIATATAILIGFVKVRFIGRWFMELRTAPLPLRLLFDGWIVLVGSVIVTMYAVG